MKRTKKMVLIFTENLERLQQHQLNQQRRNPFSLDDTAKTVNTTTMSAENNENTMRTPGDVLSRLDGEMYRILNSPTLGGVREKWKLYREVLQRYLYYFRKKEKEKHPRQS